MSTDSPRVPAFLLAFLCPLTSLGAQTPAQVPNHAQVRVALASALDLKRLQENGFDVLHLEAEGPSGLLGAHVAGTPDELARLHARGFAYDVVHADLEAYQADRLARGLQQAQVMDGPPYGFGSLGGFQTVAEMEGVLDMLHQMNPAICSARFSIGTTVEGRSIWAVKISDNVATDENEPEVYFDAMHHAREPFSMESLLWMMWELVAGYGLDPESTFLVDEREMWFVPCVNPDGYEYNRVTNPQGGGLWRKNRVNNGDGTFGVDLNRNYAYQWGYDNVGSSPNSSNSTYRGPSAFSEPETQAVRDFVLSRNFVAAIQAHTYSDLILWPYGYTSGAYTPDENLFQILGSAMAATNGWPAGTVWSILYEANGASIDWFYHDVPGNPFAFTPEIGNANDGFWPPATRFDALAASILPAYRVLARSAGGDLTVEDTQASEAQGSGNGNGFLDPGEDGELLVTLRNVSVQALGPIGMSLTSTDPHVTILDGTTSIASLAAGASGTHASDPFRIRVDPAVLPGTDVSLDLAATFQSETRTVALRVPIGTPRTLLTDLAEEDYGWSLMAPGDGAVRGLWTRADPEPTSNGPQTMQPGDDHTPLGTLCYVTDGRAGTSVGTYDVDGGPTTLTTPVFDLSNASSPALSYWRFFANSTNVNDEFVVWLSNDAGTTWHEVERLTGSVHAQWTEHTFAAADVAPATNQMQLRFVTGDEPNNSIVEALVDDLRVTGYGTGDHLGIWGRPGLGSRLSFQLSGQAQTSWALLVSAARAQVPIPGVGLLELDPTTLVTLPAGSTDPMGFGALDVTLPANPVLTGGQIHVQGLTFGTSLALSNAASFTVQS